MSDPIVENFGDIRIRLEMIEREKAKMLSVPLPEVQPIFYETSLGYAAPDYDGA